MTKSIYDDGTYQQTFPDWHVEDSAWKAGQVLRLLDRNNLKPPSVCEVGCGAGEILRTLHDALPETTFVGYEISPQALELCSTRATDRLRFEMRHVDDDPPDESFAVGLVLDVVEHVEDVFGFLRRIRPLAERMVFHIPLDLSVQSVIRPRRLLVARKSSGHLHYFTTETAFALL